MDRRLFTQASVSAAVASAFGFAGQAIAQAIPAVSYTHLTLPTILRV